MTRAKVVIVGSRGFIGSNLLSALSQHEVLPIADKQDLENFTRIVQINESPTIFVWAASKVNPVLASESPDLIENEYIEFSDFINFLNCRKSNFSDRLIFLSSGGCVYTADSESFSEISVARGVNDYGKLKLRLEKRAFEFFGETLVCRIANVYGPGQIPGRGQGVISNWFHSAYLNQPITLFGDGTEFRDFIFISDAVSAISHLIVRETSGIYNIGSGEPTTLNRIIELIDECLFSKIEVVKYPRRNFDRTGYFLNIKKIRTDTPWTPRVSVEEGINLTHRNLQ